MDERIFTRMKEKRYLIDYENNLNPSQYEAVMHKNGALLVIAGAGSGKTRTLTYRVARLVEDGVPPASILLLTFTRKASQEMLKRAALLLDQRCQAVSGGTFHSFANSILRRYAPKLGFGHDFTILDRADSEDLIKIIKKDVEIKKTFRAFPKTATIANIFGKAMNKLITIEDVILDEYPHFSVYKDDIVTIHNLYVKRKLEQSYMDYDDLLIHLKRLLSEFPDIRKRLADNYSYVMIDEYQDTNKIQADIAYLLAGESSNIMVVGDDCQSIYAFRGANFKNILDFPNIFDGAKIVRLEENYRSVQPVLSLTNSIIEKASQKFTKTLFTKKEGGNLPVLVNTGTENRQSEFVVDRIIELRDEGVPLNDIAVLFRAGFHSFDLEIEIARAGIPFIKVGGFKFMESAHIKDVLSFFKVLVNPKDRIGWYRILQMIDNVGPKAAERIFEAVCDNLPKGILKVTTKAKFKNDLERLKTLFQTLYDMPMTMPEMGEQIIKYYSSYLKAKFDDHPKRIKDLEQLLAIMERYQTPDQFVADMALEPPNTLSDGNMKDDSGVKDEDRLVLSTVHSAKGLEWHTVFIIWSLEGRFPSIHAMDKLEDYEEELRLMYVAATRARKNLYFTYPSQIYDRASDLVLSKPSSFVSDLPEEILERKNIAGGY